MFSQKQWLKTNFDVNTDKRKEANSEFAKSSVKLMNNLVSGTCIENVKTIYIYIWR